MTFTDLEPTLKKIIWDNPKNLKTEIYPPRENFFKKTQADSNNFNRLVEGFQIDTIITFHPELLEEKIKVVRFDSISYSDIDALGIHQIWGWDNSTCTLEAKVIGLTPAILLRDQIKKLFTIKY